MHARGQDEPVDFHQEVALAPGTAAPQEVEHGVGDAPGGPLRRPAAPLGGRERWLQQGPLFVGRSDGYGWRMRDITISRSSGSTRSPAMIARTTLGKPADCPLQNSFLELPPPIVGVLTRSARARLPATGLG